MTESRGAKNAYECSTCGYLLVTVDLVEGVTPFMLGCRNPAKIDGCPGPMRSHFYRLPLNAPDPTWEWYSPSKGERQYRRMSAWERDHVDRGGLLLRKIEATS